MAHSSHGPQSTGTAFSKVGVRKRSCREEAHSAPDATERHASPRAGTPRLPGSQAPCPEATPPPRPAGGLRCSHRPPRPPGGPTRLCRPRRLSVLSPSQTPPFLNGPIVTGFEVVSQPLILPSPIHTTCSCQNSVSKAHMSSCHYFGQTLDMVSPPWRRVFSAEIKSPSRPTSKPCPGPSPQRPLQVS